MRNSVLVFALSLFGAGSAGAQALSVGLIGGAPFTDVVQGTTVNGIQSIPKSANFTVGGDVQVNLPLSFRLEADALFRPYHFNLIRPAGANDISAQQYSFPILLQYRFGAPLIRPFVEGGLSFNHLAGISSAVKSAIASGPGQLLHQSDAGIVLGAGVDVHVPLIRVSGELRYIRRTVSNFADISNLNQAEVLFGIHF